MYKLPPRRGCGSPIKPAPSIKDENNTGQRCFSTRRERAVQKRNPSLLSINDGLQQFSEEPPSAYIQKGEKVCGVCSRVQNILRKKCVNLDNKISRQKCVNDEIKLRFTRKWVF